MNLQCFYGNGKHKACWSELSDRLMADGQLPAYLAGSVGGAAAPVVGLHININLS